MSRRGRAGRNARLAKAYDPRLSRFVASGGDPRQDRTVDVAGPGLEPGISEGEARDDETRVSSFQAAPSLDSLEARILALLVPWRGDPLDGGTTTGDLAAQLWNRPRSPERQELNDTLTSLRVRGLAKYEFDRMLDQAARWWRKG